MRTESWGALHEKPNKTESRKAVAHFAVPAAALVVPPLTTVHYIVCQKGCTMVEITKFCPSIIWGLFALQVQVNLCQKHLFLHQLTHNMMASSVHENSKLRTCCVQKLFFVFVWNSEQFMYTTCSKVGIFMHWTHNSINNLLSYHGLVDARKSALEKDLPLSIFHE